MYCSRRLYKGESYEICLPITDSGVTTVKFYTRGDVIIEKEPESDADGMCFSFTEEEIAALPDGVLRYSYVDTDTNTDYVIATPGDYSGSTLDDMLEDAYESGLTSCSGSSCNIQENKYVDMSQYGVRYIGGDMYLPGEGAIVVQPSSGYDGFAEVGIGGIIRATEAYNAGFNPGYTSGFTDGYESGQTQNLQHKYLDLQYNPFEQGRDDLKYIGGGVYMIWNSGSGPEFYVLPDSGYSGLLGVTVRGHFYVYEAIEDGFNSGYTSGFTDGQASCTGYTQADLDAAFASGKTAGYASGYTNGYNSGLSVSYASGYTAGYSSGYTDGLDDCGPQPEYSGTPMTFEIVSGGTIVFELGPDGEGGSGTSKYSLNDAAYTSPSSSWTVNVQSGDTLSVIGYVSANTLDEYPADYLNFSNSTASFNLKGNAMSLVAGDNFTAKTDFEGIGMLYSTFQSTRVIDASNLVLPVLDLTSTGNNNGNRNCYAWMFANCSAMTHAPKLPATTLVGGCYMGMFDDCKNLLEAPALPALVLPEASCLGMFRNCEKISQIVCLATDFLTYVDEPATQQWLNGVATPGIFYKNPNTNAWKYNDHDIYADCPFNDYCAGGVPDGWVIMDYTGQ